MVRVYLTDGTWGKDIHSELNEFLKKQDDIELVLDDEELQRAMFHGASLPEVDICICTSTNVSGQGEDTDRRLEQNIISRGIPLILIDTEPCLKIGVGPKADLTFETWSVRSEMKLSSDTIPKSFQKILDFIRNKRATGG